MQVQTNKTKLLSAVSLAERLVGKKESLPVLSCVVLEASGKTLLLRSTNLEAGVEIKIPASIEKGGTRAIPAAVLRETLRSISGENVTLSGSDDNITIESRGSKNLLKCIAYEEFPGLPKMGKRGGFSLERERLHSALSAVSYAASPSMIRPELGSVYITIDDGTLTSVATDSFRLAEKKVKGVAKKEGGEILLPLRHAQELAYVLERIEGEEVMMYTEDTQMIVEGNSLLFVSRIVDAQFPAYKEIIPKSFVAEATILKADFVEVLRKARVFSGGEQQVGFHLYPKRKIFSVTARSAEVGEMSDTIDAAVSGEDIDINFHIGYLADCLPVIQSDSITLAFAGPGKPLVIRGVSDASFMYLVMPLNR